MLPIATTSKIFQPDQQYSFTVDYFDTPFATLESDVASGGILMDLREPNASGGFTTKADIHAVGASTSALTAFNNSTSRSVVANGRVPNLIGYWAGGAPGHHGASVKGRVAYHWRCYLRSTTGRAWFSNATNPTFSIAFAGNGYFRIDKVVGGVVTNLFKGDVAETELQVSTTVSATEAQKFKFTPVISNMAAGDYLDIYYVQDGPLWGGYVFKAVLTSSQNDALAAAAPVLGCGLMDDDAARAGTLAKKTLGSIVGVEVQQSLGGAAQATIDVALINSTVNDGVGWEYVRSGDTPGFLRYNEPLQTDIDVKRQRLVRITGGYAGETQVLFTGFIEDFESIDDVTHIRCAGFEQRLLDQFMKNYPDSASYMAYPHSNVVYGIQAYDKWPLEYVLRDLMVRAGIDESKVFKNLTVAKADGTSSTVTYNSQTYQKFRGRTMAGELLQLERAAHYGNAGLFFNELQPTDDEYVFKPENTQELWNRCRELTDRYGYDFRFDALGDAWLQPRNIPHYALDVTGGGGTVKRHPSAYGGEYREYTGTVNLFTTSVTAARVDLAIPRGPSLGSWTYTVKRASDSAVMSTGTINPDSGAGSASEYFYDYRVSGGGTNPTVVTLYSGDFVVYNVELSSSGGSGSTVRRLDCFLLYHTDPLKPIYPSTFATDLNALKVQANTSFDDMRNHAIVVGRRTATVTDSSKLATNPLNPESEFVVERAVDVRSITDPTADNYVGYPKEALIYDGSIADQDVAAYLAATFVYRYRMPKPSARVEHTLVPVLQLRDPIYVVDAGRNTVDAQFTLFVTGFTHRIDEGGAQTMIETTSYQEFPSYEPREDVDVDTNFGGNPVQNVEVKYPSLDSTSGAVKYLRNLGDTVGAGTSAVKLIGQADWVGVSSALTKTKQAGSPPYLDMTGEPWPPIPGTVQVRPSAGVPTSPTTIESEWRSASSVVTGVGQTTVATVLARPFGAPTAVRVVMGNESGFTETASATITTTRSTPQPSYQDLANCFYYEWNAALRTVTVVQTSAWHYSDYEYNNVWKVQVDYNQYTEGYTAEWVTNTPYHHYFNVNHTTGTRRIALPWKEGDKTSKYGQLSSVTACEVRYIALGSNPYTDPGYGVSGGCSPFYDPYTSELGYLVELSFDALVSGFYRVSVYAPDGTVVAWLTEPTASGDEPESHWQWFAAGPGKRFFWDGVDQRGEWNSQQSVDYAGSAYGAFEQDQRPIIGKGFYVWNQERKAGGDGARAYISSQVYSNGIPEYGHGTYATWYVRIETRDVDNEPREVTTQYPNRNNEENQTTTGYPLKPKDSGTTTASTSSSITDSGKSWLADEYIGQYVLFLTGTHAGTRCTITDNTGSVLTFAPTLGSSVGTGVSYEIQPRGACIYTHLPEPTKVEIKEILDFTSSGFVETNPNGGTWGTAPDTDATINNDQPVKIRFTVTPRPGSLWDGLQGEAEVKLTRVVHLKATIFDQFIKYWGRFFAGTTTEEREVVTRRLMDDGHTVTFVDDGYRKGKTFAQSDSDDHLTQWVFLPKHFKKNFRGVEQEPILFGDYLQLQEVPSWNDTRAVAGERSRFIIAFINYLFYLSAYTQDRSGRMVWCVNRKFVDKSKILENAVGDWWDPDNPGTAANSTTYRTPWVDDPMTQHRRTVVCRQWTDEPGWVAAEAARYSMTGGTGEKLLRHKWKDHESTATQLNGVAWPTLTVDDYSRWHRDGRTELPAEFASMARQLGAAGSTSLGLWTWEGNGTGDCWVPCITRDFHPYYMLPEMVDTTLANTNSYIYIGVNPDDVAFASIWNSPVWDATQSYASNLKRFWRGFTVVKDKAPTATVNANTMNYGRQNELVHYEHLRGMWSRGPKKESNPPRKIVPVGPYYVNPYRYDKFAFRRATDNQGYPLYLTNVTPAANRGWFDMAFRSEYYWESGTLFPVNGVGGEVLALMNRRLVPWSATTAALHYDDGSWTGWKDDFNVSGEADANYILFLTDTAISPVTLNAFSTGFTPVAVGPRLTVSRDMIFHMVLLNERRQLPLSLQG